MTPGLLDLARPASVPFERPRSPRAPTDACMSTDSRQSWLGEDAETASARATACRTPQAQGAIADP